MRRHLLIVAADQHLRMVLAQALTSEGYTVRTVGSPNDALQVTLLETFDAILVDSAFLLADGDLGQRLRTLGVSPHRSCRSPTHSHSVPPPSAHKWSTTARLNSRPGSASARWRRDRGCGPPVGTRTSDMRAGTPRKPVR